ncbi:uncharacterized protein A1O5_00781 [Cladophialophora psammophila CBS 110553]|uniref:Lipid/polyisoprenoid-binding YceI-like domain-containing protein n=1 Tax=Cladophialophora psammophila CBS 110553 TaxID=1182543 RepID=W9X7Q9_9EURO|nr:uncharacterized protein A1O5_00781 [Cladophialophora psammophila CBS 110553]EXJ76273.1 hypothetical protein A1O5_00781 [Cladophialophora psammophila CBS 110553]
MSGFPTLEPALTAQITFDPPVIIGNVNSGSQLSIALINSGTLKSEPDFSPAVDAKVEFGTDHFNLTQDLKYCTIDVKAALKNVDGATISYAYKGHIEVTPELGLILGESPSAKTTDFGHVFTHVTFETGAHHLKSLETGRFVGASRFVIEGGNGPVIEMKISKIVKG